MKKIFLLSVCLVCLLSSCNIYTFYPDKVSQNYKATSPDEIKIYSGDIDRPYTVIGSVAADALGDGQSVTKFLKKKAAKLGADAIIFTELTKINTFAVRTGISGVAVKFQ